MTLLEAVNKILDNLGTHHVSATTVRHPDVVSAMDAILVETDSLLVRGYWFNTLKNVTVPVNHGKLTLGVQVLHATVQDPHERHTAVRRDRFMFNRVTNTYTFTEPMVMEQYVRLQWEELPHNAQQAVVHHAGAVVVMDKLSDTNKASTLAQSAMAYEGKLDDDELRAQRMNMFDNPRVASTRQRLRRRS